MYCVYRSSLELNIQMENKPEQNYTYATLKIKFSLRRSLALLINCTIVS